jgi:hypothetical protein
VFSILPTLIDILVAIIYFGVAFNIYFGLMVLVTMAVYLGSTVFITEWRTQFRYFSRIFQLSFADFSVIFCGFFSYLSRIFQLSFADFSVIFTAGCSV